MSVTAFENMFKVPELRVSVRKRHSRIAFTHVGKYWLRELLLIGSLEHSVKVVYQAEATKH